MELDYSMVDSNSSDLIFDDRAHILDNIYIRAGLILVYCLVFIVCFLANLAVILVVTLEWKGRLLSRFYLGNMAAANLSVALFCIPQNLSLYLLDRWIFGELMCRMFHFVTSLCHTASILILVVVSVERYLALLHSFMSRQFLTLRRLKVTNVLIWFLSAGVSLPRYFYCGLIRISLNVGGTSREICVPKQSMYNSGTADTIYFVVLYAFPLAVMSVMYLRIGMYVQESEKLRTQLVDKTFKDIPDDRNDSGVGTSGQSNRQFRFSCPSSHVTGGRLNSTKSSRNSISNACSSNQASTNASAKGRNNAYKPARPGSPRGQLRLSRARRRKRQCSVRILKYIVVTFALLNLPFHVRKLCVNFSPSFDMSSDVNNVIAPLTFLLMNANCAVNPILYVSMSSRFRGSLRALIRKCFGACARNRMSV